MSRGDITNHRGRYRARVSIEGQRVSLGVYDTRAEAQAVIDAALRHASSSTEGMTLRTWGLKWLDMREVMGMRDSRNERSRFRRFIGEHPLSDMVLRRIDRHHVQRWLRDTMQLEAQAWVGERRGKGRRISRGTVVKALRTLSRCLADAVEDGRIKRNPALGIRVPSMPTSRDPWTYLTGDEIQQLRECGAIPEGKRLIYTIAIYTGLRAGELWGLRWDDVHLRGKRPRLVVRHSYGGPTKSGKIREVPLLTPARDALERWRAMHPGIRSALVFPAACGGAHYRGFDAQWERHSKKLELGRPVRFHDLRHTCASHLIMGTWGRAWRIEEVREWLGHASVTTTERYCHLAPDSIHDAAREMEGR